MRLALNNDAARHPKTGPRRTLPTAKQRKDLGWQRRYPVLGRPSSCVWSNFNPMGTMINFPGLRSMDK